MCPPLGPFGRTGKQFGEGASEAPSRENFTTIRPEICPGFRLRKVLSWCKEHESDYLWLSITAQSRLDLVLIPFNRIVFGVSVPAAPCVGAFLGSGWIERRSGSASATIKVWAPHDQQLEYILHHNGSIIHRAFVTLIPVGLRNP